MPATYVFAENEGVNHLKRVIDLGCLAIIFNVVFVIVRINKKIEPLTLKVLDAI